MNGINKKIKLTKLCLKRLCLKQELKLGFKKPLFTKLSVLFFSFLFMYSVSAQSKEAGKTLLTKGSVVAKRSAGNVNLKRRSLIYDKDEIHVGNNARAQFRMVDKALISLQQNSVLQIRNYHYKEAGKTDSALLELISGGLRTITGAIGKGNRKAYELRTPLATIGVRGTDYEVELVSNGMFVAAWSGTIRLQSRLQGRCDLLVGRSQKLMFVFIDKSGNCRGLQKIPAVFRTGHSSSIVPIKKQKILPAVTGVSGKRLSGKGFGISPFLQKDPTQSVLTETAFGFNGFNIDLSKPSTKITSKSSAINTPIPVFKVGLDLYGIAKGKQTTKFKQSIGGLPVSWGHWGEFVTTRNSKQVDSNSKGMIWVSYQPSDPQIVSAKTGTFSRYDHVSDSMLNGSSPVKNLHVQMDVNFESGDVTNGALSANTSADTWVAVFDGKIKSGDLSLQLNGASVIDSNPKTLSPARDASGFISGDFVGKNANSIVGAFGLSENQSTKHIEGTFVVEKK